MPEILVLCLESKHATVNVIKRGVVSQARDVVVPLSSALLSHHLQWPGPMKDAELMEQGQERTMKMLRGLEHLYEQGLRELSRFGVEKRKLLGDLMVALQYLKGDCNQEGEQLFGLIVTGRGFKVTGDLGQM